MYQQYEMLAHLKSKEIEANAREDWKFGSLNNKNLFQKLFTSKISTLNPEQKTYSCATC